MKIYSVFAFIADEKVKTLTVWDNDPASYTLANEQAKILYGVDAIAVEVTNIPIIIGDSYNNGKFLRDDIEVLPLVTLDDRVGQLEERVNQLEKSIASVDAKLKKAVTKKEKDK